MLDQNTFDNRWKEILEIWKYNNWLFIVIGWLLGIVTFPIIFGNSPEAWELVEGLIPEALGIIFTVLILDTFAKNRERELLKKKVLFEVSSRLFALAVPALALMRHEGWLIGKQSLLRNANLYRADFRNAPLNHANLENVNLQYATLTSADMSYANLRLSNLSFADLSGHATLYNANLEQADLRFANLSTTNLRGCNLTNAKLDSALFNEKTMLPDANEFIDTDGKIICTSFWNPGTDITRFTDPNHPNYWQPPNS